MPIMTKLEKELHDRSSGKLVFANRTGVALTNGAFSLGDRVSVTVNSLVGLYEFVGGAVTSNTDAAFAVSGGILVRVDTDAPKYTLTEIESFASGGSANGQIYYSVDDNSLYYIGNNTASKLGGGGGASTLGGLTDVTLTDVSNGQIIKYDVTSKQWLNSTLPSVSGTIPSTPETRKDFAIQTSNDKPYLEVASAVSIENLVKSRQPLLGDNLANIGLIIDANETSLFKFASAGGGQIDEFKSAPDYTNTRPELRTYFKVTDPTKAILTESYPSDYIFALGFDATLYSAVNNQPANIPFNALPFNEDEGLVQVIVEFPYFPATRQTGEIILATGTDNGTGSGAVINISAISSSGDGKQSPNGRLRVNFKWGDLTTSFKGVEINSLTANVQYEITIIKSAAPLSFGHRFAGASNATDANHDAQLNESNANVAVLINSQVVALFVIDSKLNTSGNYKGTLTNMVGNIKFIGSSPYGAWSFDLSKIMQYQAQYYNDSTLLSQNVSVSVNRNDA